MINRLALLFLLLVDGGVIYGQSAIPNSFIKSFHYLKLDQKYEIKGFIKPFYQTADFNGDGKTDIAALVVQKRTEKKGIILIPGGSNQYYVFGAGTSFGNGSDSFKWLNGWKVYKSRTAYETRVDKDGNIIGDKKIKLKHSGIFVYSLEDGTPDTGGIIYWNGKKYLWIQQGE